MTIQTICDMPHSPSVPCIFCERDEDGNLKELPHELWVTDEEQYYSVEELDFRLCVSCDKLLVVFCTDCEGLTCYDCCRNPGEVPCLDCFMLDCGIEDHDTTVEEVYAEMVRRGWEHRRVVVYADATIRVASEVGGNMTIEVEDLGLLAEGEYIPDLYRNIEPLFNDLMMRHRDKDDLVPFLDSSSVDWEWEDESGDVYPEGRLCLRG